ncbi:MAG: response regulator [Phycisphaerae bacterium]|nr:response regulator [Phycisphaerae bacterium]
MGTMRLLLVDDEERFLSTTQSLLKRRGLEAMTATNGADGMRALAEQPVDVVILDVKMPGADGLEVLREIKHKHPLVEVIMLTGHATVESAIDGMKLGAFDYLMKPCDVDVLIQKAAEANDRKQAAEEKIRKAKIDRIISDPLSVLENDEA